MRFQDLVKLYEEKKHTYGVEVYKCVSKLLREAKELHKKDWLLHPTANNDHEQSWRSFKGKNLEKLIMYIIKDEVNSLGLKIAEGSKLERTGNEKLSEELSIIKRKILVDYGVFGCHLPDVDMVIYEPKELKVFAVISSKVTLRERIAQTGYWKLKLMQDEVTKNIRVFFITPDEDGTLTKRSPTKKGRAIVEVDTDGSYVMSEVNVEESDKVKMFDKFLSDLKLLINTSKS